MRTLHNLSIHSVHTLSLQDRENLNDSCTQEDLVNNAVWGTPPDIGHNAEFRGISTEQLAVGRCFFLSLFVILSLFCLNLILGSANMYVNPQIRVPLARKTY